MHLDLVRLARSRIGVGRYELMAEPERAPDVVDCSSFIQWLHAQFGVMLPRKARHQAAMMDVVEPDEIQPGDLIFLRGKCYQDVRGLPPDHIGHVGVVAEDRLHFIHAANSTKGIIEAPIARVRPELFRRFGRIRT